MAKDVPVYLEQRDLPDLTIKNKEMSRLSKPLHMDLSRSRVFDEIGGGGEMVESVGGSECE